MHARVASALALVFLGLSTAAPTPVTPTSPVPAHEKRNCSSYAFDQVNFTSRLAPSFCAGQVYDFTWTGGSGTYNLIQEESYPGLPVPHVSSLSVPVTRTF